MLAQEPQTVLLVQVLGNPIISKTATVIIIGVAGEAV